MVRQINPGLARLYQANLGRQYGYQNPLLIDSLSEGQQRALDLLEHGIADQQLELLPKMAAADPGEVEVLLARLGPVLRTTTSFFPELTADQVQFRFAEILRLFASTELDPAITLKKRKSSRVFINSMNPVGLTLARGLANAGIGTILTDDQVRIQRADIGPLGYEEFELGVSRSSKAKEILRGQANLEQHNRITSGYDRVDLAILCTTDVLNPRVSQRWISRDIPHILIRFDELGVEVSHLVIPGLTPCLSCIELAKLSGSSSWQMIAPQLDYLERNLADSASLLFASSIALSRGLQRLDGQEKPQSMTSIRLDFGQGVRELELDFKSCGCS